MIRTFRDAILSDEPAVQRAVGAAVLDAVADRQFYLTEDVEQYGAWPRFDREPPNGAVLRVRRTGELMGRSSLGGYGWSRGVGAVAPSRLFDGEMLIQVGSA